MSIGIGLITTDPNEPSIVLASDSRTEGEGTKRHDLPKITLIKSGSISVGIVQAGPHEFSIPTVAAIKTKLESAVSPTEQDVRRIVCDCMADQRRHIAAINPGIPHRATGCEFELILGTFEGNTPRLYTVTSFACTAKPETDGKAYIGNGKTLADYFLHQIDSLNAPQLMLAFAATYVVGIANRRVPDCEHPVRLATITPGKIWSSADSETSERFISYYESLCEKIEQGRQQGFLDSITGAIISHVFPPPIRKARATKKRK